MLAILGFWLAFGGTHVLGSSAPVRAAAVRRLGLVGFKGIYSLVALATFVPLCVAYGTHKHAGATLYVPPSSAPFVTQVLMLVALVVLCQGLLTPSPITTAAEMAGRYRSEPRGIQRITRHPLNGAFALFGLAHLFGNGSAADVVFFGGFVVYAIVSALHQDARQRASVRPEVVAFLDATSALPFAAIARGRQRLVLTEWSKTAAALSIVLWLALRHWHGALFGGAV